MNFEPVSEVSVGLRFGDATHPVGRLAQRERNIYFEYDDTFISSGLEISPINCPLQPGLQLQDSRLFDGLPGVFNDSLPDGWGRLLLDRRMRSLGILPEDLSPLDRLTFVGQTGVGALVYEPARAGESPGDTLDMDTLAGWTQQILRGEAVDVLEQVLALNGSSAGARPKAMVGLHDNGRDIIHGTHRLPPEYQHWLVKFPNAHDGADAGAIEYVYALMAAQAGLDMPEVRLFPSRESPGWFAVRRFDRHANRRLHMHTACGLLHSDFRTPSLDYRDLTALTMTLTKDIRQVERMYRLAVFNVLAHNRDDHSKNFSFLMNETGEWTLSPAYDLTFSSGPGGEQSTTVMGEGRHPGGSELAKLGMEAKLPERTVREIIDQTRAALADWKRLAAQYGVSRANVKLLGDRL